MGSSMASRLLSSGYTLTIYARTPSKALHLQSQGAQLAPSPAAVARTSDVVFTMVGHPSDVRSTVLSNSGILSGLNPGGVAVDMTSSQPGLAREIFTSARDKDCWAVDAPVSGGDIGARDGKLAIFAAGERAVVEWLEPLFDVMGKATYVGGAGKGQSCKIANQITVGANLMGLAEGLIFAGRAGMNIGRFVEAIKSGAAGSMVAELFGERMAGRDFRAGGFAEYIVKDLGMAANDEDAAVALPGVAMTKQFFLGMVANGDGKLGIQGLVTVLERINGN